MSDEFVSQSDDAALCRLLLQGHLEGAPENRGPFLSLSKL